ncbi:hypothetical protein PGB90_009065 [Kerria lacca]
MCITFFYFNRNVFANQYRFILVFNRDEFYYRNTENAHFWKEFPTVIGGRDSESSSRGTWLAASTNGKIGALLNIDDTSLNRNLKSRGVLVSEYVCGNLSPSEYIKKLSNNKKVYNGYNLLLFDLMSNESNNLAYTNANQGKFQETSIFPDGVHGISNTRVCTPYKKVEYGIQKFQNIAKKYNYVNKRNSLIEKLKKLLESTIKNYPDDLLYQIKKNKMKENHIRELSSIFVKIPEASYGTRTHTIILVDHNNVMDYVEYSMNDANDLRNLKWVHQNFIVHLHQS